MSSEIVYGWDQFYKTIESDINKKADVLIALFHFVTKHYNFSCVGAASDVSRALDSGRNGFCIGIIPGPIENILRGIRPSPARQLER